MPTGNKTLNSGIFIAIPNTPMRYVMFSAAKLKYLKKKRISKFNMMLAVSQIRLLLSCFDIIKAEK